MTSRLSFFYSFTRCLFLWTTRLRRDNRDQPPCCSVDPVSTATGRLWLLEPPYRSSRAHAVRIADVVVETPSLCAPQGCLPCSGCSCLCFRQGRCFRGVSGVLFFFPSFLASAVPSGQESSVLSFSYGVTPACVGRLSLFFAKVSLLRLS